MHLARNRSLIVATVACLTLAFSGVVASVAGSTTKGAAPIKLMVLGTFSGPGAFLEIPAGAQAAADAINRQGGVSGHPIQILVCDDQSSPNDSAACARRAVAQKVLAVVGAETTTGNSYMPIIAAAGIPSISNGQNSSLEATSPDSYPLESASVQIQGWGVLFKSIHAKRLFILSLQSSAVSGLVQLVTQAAAKNGLSIAGQLQVPFSQVDFSVPVAQIVSSKADAVVPILVNSQLDELFAAERAAGLSLETTLKQTAAGLSQQDVTAAGSVINGLYLDSGYFPATYTKNKGIAQFNSELAAAGDSHIEKTERAFQAWASVHIIANLIKHINNPTAHSLVKAMKAAGVISFPGVAPFNWSKPIASYLPIRVYQDQLLFLRVEGGVIRPLTGRYVNISSGKA